jgi:hypothetical protein
MPERPDHHQFNPDFFLPKMTAPQRPRMKSMLPPQCPTCGQHAPWLHLIVPQEQDFRGTTLAITAPLHQCSSCGFRLLTTEDAKVLLHATSRHRHASVRSTRTPVPPKSLP